MKSIVAVQLYPKSAHAVWLRDTLTTSNKAANMVSAAAWHNDVKSREPLQHLRYTHVKAMGLSAQPALHIIRKVADAYTTLKANIHAGNLGDPESKRRIKVESKPIHFHWNSSQPYDDRCLSWRPADYTVSIWTTFGRIRVPFKCSDEQLATLVAYRKGETDLIFRDGMWFLHATCEIPDVDVTEPTGFLGVDLGITNIATTNDGIRYSGKKLNRVRHRAQSLRTKLQKKSTRSTKRLLKKRRRKEERFARDTNHVISKRIVTEAQRTGRGIALEELTGIRDRVRLRKPQRVTLHSWAFRQLGEFITYKAARAGVAVVYADPAYTSQRCAACGHISKSNRPNQPTFICTSCGFAEHADVNAAWNIEYLGELGWALVMEPGRNGKRSRLASYRS
jgi:putative transposase